MASDNNIFEILQKVAENTSSNEKLLGILRENGYRGTLEDAGRKIQQAEQIILENLTSDDLKNIAGGKSLMNEKLKKIIAVGGASLMAGSAAVPTTHATNGPVNYVKKHPIQSGIAVGTTATAAVSTIIALILGNQVRTLKNQMNKIPQQTMDLISNILKSMPNGDDILQFMNLDLTNISSVAELQLEAHKDKTGDTKGTSTTIESSYVKVNEGTTDKGMMADNRLLEGLSGKIISLEHLATYMVYKASGTEKPVVPPDKKNDPNLFKTLTDDPYLESYQKKNLTGEGQIVVEILAHKMFTAQKHYQKNG